MTKHRFDLQKGLLNQLGQEHFDVVYATYGELENVYAGKYAAKLFHCKWILDFRDPIAQGNTAYFLKYAILKSVQRKAVLSADVCTTVSEGLSAQLASQVGGLEIVTLYNGYDEAEAFEKIAREKNILSFCYTGTLYPEKSDLSPLFWAIQYLLKHNGLKIDRIRFDYAGGDFEALRSQALKYGVEQILVNHGYVSRQQAFLLQQQDDIFVVSSWNTRKYQGILTGKFYEGIRGRIPILAVVSGNMPNSELFHLNQLYRYGFCYEQSDEKSLFPKLCDWILGAYHEKTRGKEVPYNPEPDLFQTFRYDQLAKQLEAICEKQCLNADRPDIYAERENP